MRFILTLILLAIASTSLALPSFPGAQGFGSDTVGGRGGDIYIVDTISDNPAEGVTFREAVEASGPRIIVFAVSGVIMLNSNLTIANDYITIAGQTSPGGISVAGASVNLEAHDVIIRHMRFRGGTEKVVYHTDGNGDIIYYDTNQYAVRDSGGECIGNISTYENGYPCALSSGIDPNTIHAMQIHGDSRQDWYPGADARNIIIDHCSFSYGLDETLSLTESPSDITISNSIVSDGILRGGHDETNHAMCMLLSFKEQGLDNISVHNNYMGNCTGRLPFIAGQDFIESDTKFVDFKNNVILMGAATNGASSIGQSGSANIVNNWSKSVSANASTAMGWLVQDLWSSGHPANRVYMSGNKGSGLTINSRDADWSINRQWYTDEADPATYERSTPYPIATAYTVTTEDISQAWADSLVTSVGATVPIRDSVDTAAISDYTAGVASIKNNVFYPADYPTYSTANDNPTDTDSDGMPDAWESANGTNPSIADDDVVINSGDYTGYTNIEWYLSDLAGDVATPSTTTCYPDTDSDTYGDSTSSGTERETCLTGEVTNSLDCDDSNTNINPGATKVCIGGVWADCSGACSVTSGSSFTGSTGAVYYTDGEGKVSFQ